MVQFRFALHIFAYKSLVFDVLTWTLILLMVLVIHPVSLVCFFHYVISYHIWICYGTPIHSSKAP